MKKVFALLTLGLFTLAMAQSAAADAAAKTQALFYAETPNSGAKVLAEAQVDAAASLDLQGARYVVLKTADHAYSFALDTKATAQGKIDVLVNGSSRSMSEVAAQLEAASQAKSDLAIFSKGQPEQGIVVGVYSLARAEAQVNAEGATYVQLFKDGKAQTFAVDALGDTLADVKVKSQDNQGSSESLLDASLNIGIGVSGEASSDSGSAEGSAEGGVNVGVGIGGDSDGN